jgi:hypothetical protein
MTAGDIGVDKVGPGLQVRQRRVVVVARVLFRFVSPHPPALLRLDLARVARHGLGVLVIAPRKVDEADFLAARDPLKAGSVNKGRTSAFLAALILGEIFVIGEKDLPQFVMDPRGPLDVFFSSQLQAGGQVYGVLEALVCTTARARQVCVGGIATLYHAAERRGRLGLWIPQHQLPIHDAVLGRRLDQSLDKVWNVWDFGQTV